jgi:TrwC relaxase
VVADIAKLSVGREEYYTHELVTDHGAYLSGHGESPGRWYGAGASSLGLQGEASVAGFQAMFEGCDPTTGELLGRSHGGNAVPAFFDVVLRPTKSVSILYGTGRAHEEVERSRPEPSRCRIAHNRRTRKSSKEIREAVSDRGRGVRSRSERPPTRALPRRREPRS